jgi:hypothetical protein
MRSKIAEKISAKTSESTKKSLKKFIDELIILRSARYKFLKVIDSDKVIFKNQVKFVFTYNPNKKPVRSEYNVKSDYPNDYNAWKRQLRTVEFIDKSEERRVWNYFFALNNNSIEKTWSALEKGIEVKDDLIMVEKILFKDKDTKESKSSFKAYLNVSSNFIKKPTKDVSKNEISNYDNLRLIIMDELNNFTDKKGTINLNRKDFTNFANQTSKKINETL